MSPMYGETECQKHNIVVYFMFSAVVGARLSVLHEARRTADPMSQHNNNNYCHKGKVEFLWRVFMRLYRALFNKCIGRRTEGKKRALTASGTAD